MTATHGPPPPFDAELGAVLAPVAELVGLTPTLELLPHLRQPNDVQPMATDEELRAGGAYAVRDLDVPDTEGVRLLVRRPVAATAPTPVVYWIHGGGMVTGDYRGGLAGLGALADPVGATLVSVQYRLAPETPHPGPVEDCYAGLTWLAANTEELGLDPGRIV